MKKEISDADVIGLFGGPSALGTILRVDRRVVSNWKSRNIPKPWKLVLYNIASQHGVRLPKGFIDV